MVWTSKKEITKNCLSFCLLLFTHPRLPHSLTNNNIISNKLLFFLSSLINNHWFCPLKVCVPCLLWSNQPLPPKLPLLLPSSLFSLLHSLCAFISIISFYSTCYISSLAVCLLVLSLAFKKGSALCSARVETSGHCLFIFFFCKSNTNHDTTN